MVVVGFEVVVGLQADSVAVAVVVVVVVAAVVVVVVVAVVAVVVVAVVEVAEAVEAVDFEAILVVLGSIEEVEIFSPPNFTILFFGWAALEVGFVD